MITPTRFGLKYAPIPTLALEYEDDGTSTEGDLGLQSLYVLKDDGKPRRAVKKLHVVELPLLTPESMIARIVKQLQQDNRRFLGPDIVREDQLARLLQLLMDHLQNSQHAATEHENATNDLEASQNDLTFGDTDAEESHDAAENEAAQGSPARETEDNEPSEAEHHEDDEGEQSEDNRNAHEDTTRTTDAEEGNEKHDADDADADANERAEDAKKAEILKDNDAKEESDEEIASEELEYLSEEESDEDSF